MSLAALALAAPAAMAGQIMPNLYASEYCSMRNLGVNAREARTAAVAASYVSSLPDMPQVTIGGEKFDADVVQAMRAVESRCPQYLGD